MLEILTSLRSTDGPDCSENVFKMFQTLDGDGDGQISEEEFIETFLKIVNIFKWFIMNLQIWISRI